MEDALKQARDAKRAWLEAALEEGLALPDSEAPAVPLQLPPDLYACLSKHSKEMGMSLPQYCVHVLHHAAQRP